MTATSIEWTDVTWNPIRGCSRVSAGCEHCYAERVAARFSGPGLPYEGLARRRSNGDAQWTGEVRFIESKLMEPLKWREPKRVFVNSMSDLFHENVSDETLDRIFAVMAKAQRHTFQILTKRPERMRAYSASRRLGLPLPNVWLGVSVENQSAAYDRIPLLLGTPAAVRFLSCEPLLGPVDLGRWLFRELTVRERNGIFDRVGGPYAGAAISLARQTRALDWVVAGGESGPGARPCNTERIAAIVADCELSGTPCFVKQLGTAPVVPDLTHWTGAAALLEDGRGYRITMKDSKGGDPGEWPRELRVRQFPAVP